MVIIISFSALYVGSRADFFMFELDYQQKIFPWLGDDKLSFSSSEYETNNQFRVSPLYKYFMYCVKFEWRIMTKYKVVTYKMIPLSHERMIVLNSFVVISKFFKMRFTVHHSPDKTSDISSYTACHCTEVVLLAYRQKWQ